MRRTVFLVLLLVVLVGAVWYFSQKEETLQTASEYEGSFAVKNVDDIGKIVMEHRAGPTYTLTRGKDGWLINETHPARMSSVTPLLDAISQVTVQYIPGDAAMPNVMENINGTYVHVEVYSRSGEQLKGYRIGGSNPDERGTYMIMDGSEQPFVVHIPHWDGALRTRYTLTMDEWRDRKFMPVDQEDITAVSVNYPRQQSQSFRLERSGSGFIFSPLYPDLKNYIRNYREGTGEAFLKALSEAACEGFENQYPKKDSIYGLVPFCEIQIERAEMEPVAVRIWPKGTPVYTQHSSPVHRLFIDVKPGDFVLAQYEVVKGMLRGYDFFTGQETELVF